MAIQQELQVTRTSAVAPSSAAGAVVPNASLLRTALATDTTASERALVRGGLGNVRLASAEGARAAIGRPGGAKRDIIIGVGIGGTGPYYPGPVYGPVYGPPVYGPVYPPVFAPPPPVWGPAYGRPRAHPCGWFESLFKHDFRGPYGQRYCQDWFR